MNRGKWLLAISCSLLAVFINSCKEDTGSVGANVLPNSDIISASATDTTTLLTSMYLKDSVFTSGGLIACQLGSYNDPIFGETKSSIYAQVFAPVGATYVPWVDDSVTVDSAVLSLPYYSTSGSCYGNLDPQTFVVDTLESVIHATNSIGSAVGYYSDTTIKYSAHPIAEQQVTPSIGSGQLRIKMSSSWTQYITSKLKGNSYYYTYFDSLIKGIYITTNNPVQLPGQGGILQMNLISPVGQGNNSVICFYMHYQHDIIGEVPHQVNFPVGNSTIPTSFFSHSTFNYATASFGNEHATGVNKEIDGNNFVYIQSMGGVIGRINFPNLYKNWSKLPPLVINEAEIIMSVDAQDAASPFVPSPQLQLLATDSLGLPYATADYNQSYYGGVYDASNNTYTFVITQYIQKVIDGKITDRGMFIIPYNEAITANRGVLYGAQHNEVQTNKRMKMVIYYTPLPTHAAKKH